MKKAFCIGAATGGIIGAIIALSMDFLLGNAVGGSWSEAVAHDLNYYFKANLPANHALVILGVFIVIGIIIAFGSLIGGVFSMMIARLFSMLIKEEKKGYRQ